MYIFGSALLSRAGAAWKCTVSEILGRASVYNFGRMSPCTFSEILRTWNSEPALKVYCVAHCLVRRATETVGVRRETGKE